MVAMLAKMSLYQKFDKNYFIKREWVIGHWGLGIRHGKIAKWEQAETICIVRILFPNCST